jgi:hypothetical protein
LIDGDALLALLSILYPTPAARSQLMSLNIYYCYKVTDAHIEALCSLYPNIRELNLGKCILLTEHCLPALGSLPRLRSLCISGTLNLSPIVQQLLNSSMFPSLRMLDAEPMGNAHIFSGQSVTDVIAVRPKLQVMTSVLRRKKDGKKRNVDTE